MLRTCEYPDCTTLTLGALCVVHEPAVATQRFPRGRPYSRRERRLPLGAEAAALGNDELTRAYAVSFGGATAR